MRFADRGNPVSGLLTTPRDARLPVEAIRDGANFALSDRRVSRRRGLAPFTSQRVEGQQLSRSAPNTYLLSDKDTNIAGFGKLAVTPNGYGMIRWADDFQPKTTRNWTVEFLLTLGELDDISVTRSRRQTNNLYGGARILCRANDYGHVVYDQSVIVDYCDIAIGGVTQNIRPPSGAGVPTSNLHDTVVIPALSVSYTAAGITAVLGWYDTTNNRYDFHDTAKQLIYAWGAYPGSGTAIHVAITYTLSSRTAALVVDGVSRDTYVVPADYRIAGEVEAINAHTTAVQRDIVLLNECTVRHNYASTCKLTHASSACAVISCTEENTTGSFGDVEPPGSLFHAAPGRGAGMCELRMWHTNRSTTDLAANKLKPLVGNETNLIGYWRLNDGCSTLIDLVGNRHGSLHNTFPAYVADAGFIRGSGMRFADNNFIIGEIDARDPYQSDLGEILRRLMLGSDNPKSLSGLNWVGSECQAGNDITFQFQVRVPTAQQEHDRRTTGVPGGAMALAFQNETRERPGNPAFFVECDPYRLRDGQHCTLANYLGEIYTGAAPSKAVYHPAFDQTIFSVEARASQTTFRNVSAVTAAGNPTTLTLSEALPSEFTTGVDYQIYVEGLSYALTPATNPNGNWYCRVLTSTTIQLFTAPGAALDTTGGGAVTRVAAFVRILPQGAQSFRNLERLVPLYRGLFTPTLQLAFEFYGYGMFDTSGAGAWEHRSFYHRCTTTATYSAGDVLNVSFVKRTLFELTGGSYVRKGFVMEIYVNGALAQAMERIFTGTGANTNIAAVYHRPFSRCQAHEPRYYISVGASYIGDGVDFSVQTPGGTTGTWKLPSAEFTPQRKMSARQDLPGFFSLGYFRIWGQGMSLPNQNTTSGVSIADRVNDSTLLVNLEIDQITGDRIANKARYPILFDLGYKSWTVPQFVWFGSAAQRPSYGWALEDCLSYSNRPSTFDSSTCGCGRGNMLAFFNATLSQNFGLLAVFEDSLFYDSRLSGILAPVYIPQIGLMNEFIANQKWDATNIGDRSYLSAFGAVPKSFDGRIVNYLGFPRYRGPRLSLATTNTSTGNVPSGKYYRLVITYYSDELGIEQIGSSGTIYVPSGDNTIVIAGTNQFAGIFTGLAQSPDSRVTSIRIYRSRGQDSYLLAREAPVFQVGDEQSTNRYILSYSSIETDVNLGDPLIEEYTRPPVGEFVASWDDSLWIAGDPIFPDTVYNSFTGSPDLWDTVTRSRVLESGSGDRITGLVPLFGSLYVFKPGAIWRIDKLNNGEYDKQQLFSIGAVSSRSIAVVTLPDDGRTVIVFWSKHGPYMTDGTSLHSIGYPIEVRDGSQPYGWLDDQTVFVSHDIQRRELWFYYKPIVDETTSDRFSEAVVFNYRFQTWSRATGMIAMCASTGAIANAGTGLVAELGPSEWSPLDSNPITFYGAFVSGLNGLIYTLKDGVLDGLDETASRSFTVSSFASPLITANGSPAWTVNQFRGLWLCVVDASLNYKAYPIASNTANTITLSSGYPFYGTPVIPAGSTCYIAQTPLVLEYPWDACDIPGFDKTVSQILIYLNGVFQFKFGMDWNTIPTTWELVTGNTTRRLIRPNKDLEVIKLFLLSWSLGARVDQYGYRYDSKSEPHRSSQ